MNIKRSLLSVFLFVLAGLPLVALAAGLVPCNGPDCNFNSLATLVNNIINWFLGISVSVAAITFSIAGAQILFNRDKPAKLEDAKGIFMKTIIGLIIVLCSWLVIHTIIATLASNPNSALRFLGN